MLMSGRKYILTCDIVPQLIGFWCGSYWASNVSTGHYFTMDNVFGNFPLSICPAVWTSLPNRYLLFAELQCNLVCKMFWYPPNLFYSTCYHTSGLVVKSIVSVCWKTNVTTVPFPRLSRIDIFIYFTPLVTLHRKPWNVILFPQWPRIWVSYGYPLTAVIHFENVAAWLCSTEMGAWNFYYNCNVTALSLFEGGNIRLESNWVGKFIVCDSFGL